MAIEWPATCLGRLDRETNLQFSAPDLEKNEPSQHDKDSLNREASSPSIASNGKIEFEGPLPEPEPVRTAADIVGIGFWAYSRASRTYSFSDRSTSLLGFSGAGPFDLTAILSNEDALTLKRSLIDERRIELSVNVVLSDNSSTRILIQGWPEYRNSDRVVGTLTQIPAEDRLSSESIAADPLLVEAMEYGPDSMLVLRAIRNHEGVPVDFEVVESNSRGSQLLGYSRVDAKGRLIGQLMPEAQEDGTIERYAEIMRTGQAVEQEYHVSPGGFQRIWIKQRVVPLEEGVAIFSSDISDSRLANETADRSRRMFERIAITTPDALMLWDVDTRRFIYENRQLSLLLDDTLSESQPISFSKIEHGLIRQDLKEFKQYIGMLAGSAQDSVSEAIFHFAVSTGEIKHLLFRSSVFDRKANGQPKTILSSAQDVTEQSAHRSQLESQMLELKEVRVQLESRQRELESLNTRLSDMALTDAITGIKNRRAFQEKLEEESERAQRYNSRLALVLADIDYFKRYNDKFGHPAGDQALKAFAQVLLEVCRKSDTVARYGGEEFAIILPNTGAAEAGFLGERVRTALARTLYGQQGLTASLGCSEFLPGKDGRERLVSESDKALYQSKDAGRDRVTVFKA